MTSRLCLWKPTTGRSRQSFVAEVPDDAPTGIQVVLRAAAATAQLDPVVDVVSSPATTHLGGEEMTVRDPDGRDWVIQVPPGPRNRAVSHERGT